MIQPEDLHTVILYSVFAVFTIAFLAQIFYYLGFFARLAFHKPSVPINPQLPVSVIICAKNEYKNLKQNLPLIFAQDYPEFQVVVVNDCSYDDSLDFLKELAKQHSNLKIVNINEDEVAPHSKKFALALGIKGSQHVQLLLTDADCAPENNQWLSLMQSNFSDKNTIVLGYGAYEKKDGLLNKLIRFDTFYVAVQYLSFALAGIPYMGVGRNLAYKKELFFKNKGFGSHNHIASGDDDLFINEIAHSGNTKIEIRPGSKTISDVKTTYSGWYRQKRRHLSTGSRYKFLHKMLLGIHMASHMFFYITLVALLALQFHPEIVAGAFAFRLLIQLIIFKKISDKLGDKDLLLFSPLLDIIVLPLNILFAGSNLFIRQPKWK